MNRNLRTFGVLAVLLVWGCGPDGKTAKQNASVQGTKNLSREVAAWLDRYGEALDDSDRFLKQLQQLYDESVALWDRHGNETDRRPLTSVRNALEAILLAAPGSGRIHDEQRALRDPQFKATLERRLEGSLESLRLEAFRLKGEGKAARARTLLDRAAACFQEGTPAREKVKQVLSEMTP